MRYCRRSPSWFLVILTFPVAHIAHAIVVPCIRTRLPLCLRTLPTFLSPPKTTRFRCSPFAYYLSISVLLSAAVPIRATAVRSNALAKFPKDSSRSPLGSSALPRLSSSKCRPCSRSRFRRSDSSRATLAADIFVSCGSKRVLTAVWFCTIVDDYRPRNGNPVLRFCPFRRYGKPEIVLSASPKHARSFDLDEKKRRIVHRSKANQRTDSLLNGER